MLVLLDLVQNHSDLYERLYHLEAGTWRQVLESRSGPPRAVLEVLELIASVASKEGQSIPRGGRYASDKLLYSLLCASMPYDGDSLAGNGVRARLALCDWGGQADDASAFVESPTALVYWAPVVEDLKELDEEIVRNSIRYRWIEVRRELHRNLDAAGVMGTARSHGG